MPSYDQVCFGNTSIPYKVTIGVKIQEKVIAEALV